MTVISLPLLLNVRNWCKDIHLILIYRPEVLEPMKKCRKNKHFIQLNILIDQLPFHDMYFLPYRDQGSFLGHQH